MYLGIDLGTTEIKILLLSSEHRVIAVARSALGISRPHAGWSEQSPADWWAATESAVNDLRAQAPQAWSQVRAIGLSGQMHGAVLLDAAGQVLRPAILWNDGRSAAECARLMRDHPDLVDLSGNLAMPGFTAPKLVWLSAHEPHVHERVAKVLLPKDYLRLRLTGRCVTDMSDAAGTLWLDVGRREWSPALLRHTGMRRDQMPELVEGSASTGPILPELARAWGLDESVIVAGGGGDNAASAVGIGATEPGDGFISLGTSGVLFVTTDAFRPNPGSAVHAFCHALPERWHQMAVMLSAGASLGWLTRLLGATDEAKLLAPLADRGSERDASTPLFLPYLGGERTPHNDPDARGVFFGLEHASDAVALTRSVLEGVAFGMRDGLLALRAAGSAPTRLGFIGGGARSALWAQLHADVLGIELAVLDGATHGAALGAARLAWIAAGASVAEACSRPPLLHAYHPDPARHERLLARYERWRRLYGAVRDLFPRQSSAA
jgi:xylulokinase